MLKTCTVVRIIEPEIGRIHALAAGNVAPGTAGKRRISRSVMRCIEAIRDKAPVPFFGRATRTWWMEGRSLHD